MSIRVNLDKILANREMSLTQLSERVGVTIANLSILKTGKARAVRFSTLDALCQVLQCQPGDILCYDATADDIALQGSGRSGIRD
ncbi:MAG TPA: helix-turn-helix transcriptional regulator [Steroidobacteraceae bacterium]|jgi:putative transcriptional regulator|nr:helix-turn-helix transcriptional regulator [Steroidobacteraceae bacterium]